jgi:uncharacterized protein YdeI (YjbR/CyaY-like superfamily)
VKKKTATSKPMVKRLFKNQAAWHAWLLKNHEQPDGVWLHFAKKNAGAATVTYVDALDSALCFGWIDGQTMPHDDRTFLRKFTPRRARSLWSKINRVKAESLIKNGKMQPAGLRQIETARADGRWETAYDSAKSATVPPDLQAALDKSARAAAFFAKLDRTNRYSVLWRVQTARTPALRAKRITEIVAMLKLKKVFHPEFLK